MKTLIVYQQWEKNQKMESNRKKILEEQKSGWGFRTVSRGRLLLLLHLGSHVFAGSHGLGNQILAKLDGPTAQPPSQLPSGWLARPTIIFDDVELAT
jgi:hypothetical protein